MAFTGHVSTHAPQSMHSSGSMKFMSSPSSEWMQSTGHTSTQVASLVPMHGCVITKAIGYPLSEIGPGAPAALSTGSTKRRAGFFGGRWTDEKRPDDR